MVVVLLVVLAFLVMRKKAMSKPFDFQPMSHSELEAKDLENYLGTEEGSFPSTKTGVIATASKNGSAGSSGEGGGKEKTGLRDVDLENQEYETSSVKGHLV